VSFYTTELPEYLLVEVFRGMRSDVVRICAALTYTLLVVLAAGIDPLIFRRAEQPARSRCASGRECRDGGDLGDGSVLSDSLGDGSLGLGDGGGRNLGGGSGR
jgi:hypothetical protein